MSKLLLDQGGRSSRIAPDSAMQTNEERVTGLPFVAKMEIEDRLSDIWQEV